MMARIVIRIEFASLVTLHALNAVLHQHIAQLVRLNMCIMTFIA